MEKNLTGYVGKYLNNRIHRKHLLLTLLGLSICTVVMVYSTLLLPAFSVVRDNIFIDADPQKCVFGGTLTANVSANVKADQSEKIFLIKSVCSEASLSSKYAFSDGVAQITTEKGEQIELRRGLNKDGSLGYWFSLSPDKSADFNLDFVSDKNAESAPEGSEASVVLYFSYVDTLDEAQNFYDSENLSELSDNFITLTWMTQTDFEKMQSEFDLNTADENSFTNGYFDTLQSFGAEGDGSGSGVALDISKTIDYLGDGTANTHTSLSGNDSYRLYMDIVNTMTTSTPTDLLFVVDRSASMDTPDMTISSGGSVTRSQAVVNLLNGEGENTGLIQQFLALNSGNKIAITWFAGATPITASTTAGVAKSWTGSAFTVDASDSTINNAGHLGFFSSGGGTNYMTGLWQAADTLNTVSNDGNQKLMIFLSDGIPTYFVYKSSSYQTYPNINTMSATYADHVANPTNPNLRIGGNGSLDIDNISDVNMFSKAAITDFKANIPSGTIIHTISYGTMNMYKYTSTKSEAMGYDASNPNATTQAMYGGKLVWISQSSSTSFQLANSKPWGYVAAYVKQVYYDYTINTDATNSYSQATMNDGSGTKYVWIHNATHALALFNQGANPSGFSKVYVLTPIYTKDQPTGASQATYNGNPVWINSSTGVRWANSEECPDGCVAAYLQPVDYLLEYLTYNGGKCYDAENTISLSESVKTATLSVPVQNIEITDNLSLYADWYDALPDLKVTRTLRNNPAAVPLVLWSSSGPAVSGTIGSSTSYNTDNGITIIQSVTYTPSTDGTFSGSVALTFNPNWIIDSQYSYELSFNICASDYAYHAYADSGGYGSIVGDAYTDYSITSNSTSSGKPGFYSNYMAQVTYTSNGTSHSTVYPYPVIQVTPASLGLFKTNLSGSPLENVEFKVFKAYISGSEWIQGDQYGGVGFTDSIGNLNFTGVRPGTYLLYETRTHTGYNLPEIPWKLTVTNISGTVSTILVTYSGDAVISSGGVYTIKNSGNYTLPYTGGTGVMNIYVCGGLIIMYAGMGLYLKSKRRS